MFPPPRLALLPLVAVSTLASAADWPQWRGPHGQGHAQTAGLPKTWSETSNIAWRSEIPGRGWSSPVIAGNQIWLTTAIETPADPGQAQSRLKANTGDQPLNILEQVELRAVCVDRDTGRIVHNVLVLTEREPQWVHQLNSYASPSPVIESGRLYCHFGTFGTACVETQKGQVLWTNRTLRIMHENGPGSSPVVWKNLVIFHLDGSDAQYVAALDKGTGKLVWKTSRSGEMHANPQFKKSYGTPLVLDVNGKPQLISPGSDWLYSYDPASGSELWKLKYGSLGFSLVPRPVTGHGMIYMSTGFMRSELLAIRYEKTPTPEIAWRYNQGVPKMSSPLLVGNELYFVSDNGILTCLDALTGAEIYRERLGGDFSSTPIFADGNIYVANRLGTTFVVAPGRQFRVLAKNELPGAVMATPAAVDGALYLRTDSALYRIEEKK